MLGSTSGTKGTQYWTGSLPPGTTTTWDASVEHQITGTVTVERFSTLVIEPGASVRVAAGASIVVNGVLLAHGTPTQPVTITGLDPVSTWAGVVFDSQTLSYWEGSPLDLTVTRTASHGAFGPQSLRLLLPRCLRYTICKVVSVH